MCSKLAFHCYSHPVVLGHQILRKCMLKRLFHFFNDISKHPLNVCLKKSCRDKLGSVNAYNDPAISNYG